MHHELKILPPYFEAVTDGRKTFEIRKDDRGFQAGDTVTLREYDPECKGYHRSEEQMYSGRKHDAAIGYVTAYEQQPGYVVFSLVPNVALGGASVTAQSACEASSSNAGLANWRPRCQRKERCNKK